jgi:polysaccharide biosynthesis/export protein
VTLATASLTTDQSIDPGTRASQLASGSAFLETLRKTEPDGRIVLDLAPNATALPGSLPVENNDRIVIPARASTVGVFGAVYRPASFLFDDARPLRVREYVDRAGGPIRAADRNRLFVVRANGAVVPKQRGALDIRVLPGDVIFIPTKTQSTSILARIGQITSIVSQIGFTAAALAVLNNQ